MRCRALLFVLFFASLFGLAEPALALSDLADVKPVLPVRAAKTASQVSVTKGAPASVAAAVVTSTPLAMSATQEPLRQVSNTTQKSIKEDAEDGPKWTDGLMLRSRQTAPLRLFGAKSEQSFSVAFFLTATLRRSMTA
jgi:hypothetical protein